MTSECKTIVTNHRLTITFPMDTFISYTISRASYNGVLSESSIIQVIQDNHLLLLPPRDNHSTTITTNTGGIDLDATGKRWEGGIRNDKPFGYGVLYNEEGEKEYEGFVVDGLKTYHGTEYYCDMSTMHYDGFYFNDRKQGYGTLYDRTGVIVYQGLWKNDNPASIHFDGNTIDSTTESVMTQKWLFNRVKTFSLCSYLSSLKRLMINDSCFRNARVVSVIGLPALEVIVIGNSSFRFGYDKRDDGCCRIEDCPKLLSIYFGRKSFRDYRELRLIRLPVLQDITIGYLCFFFAPILVISGPFQPVE